MAKTDDSLIVREVGEIIKDRYEVLEVLGKGGLSRVYHVRSIETGREWAMKEYSITKDEKRAFTAAKNLTTEAEALNNLRCRGIPYIRDAFTNNGNAIIIMERRKGKSLSDSKYKNRALEPEFIRRLSVKLCDILSVLHKQRPAYIYRDIKPANVMIEENGQEEDSEREDIQVSLIDFGTVRRYEEGLKRDPIALGTPEYAPPELCGLIEGQTDARSDIYSLGIMIYQLATGEAPGSGEKNKKKAILKNRKRIVSAIKSAEKEIPLNNDTREEGLLRIAEKCTRWNPDDRFQSVEELKHALIHSNEICKRYISSVITKRAVILVTAIMFSGLTGLSIAGCVKANAFTLPGKLLMFAAVIILALGIAGNILLSKREHIWEINKKQSSFIKRHFGSTEFRRLVRESEKTKDLEERQIGEIE